MSTDRNEKISNHEKDMFRDSLKAESWTKLVSFLGHRTRSFLQVHDAVAHAGTGGKSMARKLRPLLSWKEEVMYITPWCGTL